MTAVVGLPGGVWLGRSRLSAGMTKIARTLAGEVRLVNHTATGRGAALILCAVFTGLLMNNFLGLLPYVFTASRHVRVTLPLRLLLWLRLTGAAAVKTFTSFIAHLVPKGTPPVLVPFIVLIEIIRSVMRPFTLAVRLAANMVAGHLLLVLVSSPAPFLGFRVIIPALVGLLALTVLELGVSVIQRYVFTRLRSLYLREVNRGCLNL